MAPDRADRLLREAGFASSKELPVEAVCWLEPDQTPRRLDAVYPNGWRASARITKDAHVELYTERLILKVRIEATKAELAANA